MLLLLGIVSGDEVSIEPQDVCEEGLPVGMRAGELAEVEHVTKVFLRSQEIAKPLAIIPWLERPPIKQTVEQLPGAFEGDIDVIPLEIRQVEKSWCRATCFLKAILDASATLRRTVT